MSFRSRTLTDSAEYAPCGNCGNRGTTVAAHANKVSLGKGTGIKVPDFYVADLCDVCHALVDGRLGKLTKEEKWELWLRAYLKTIARWFNDGVVAVK
ncbi:MAG: DUF1364 domain-containing protein [Nitrospira sp.]|nr:DUF1364 domain-containing protein [Nitrospira sp.]